MIDPHLCQQHFFFSGITPVLTRCTPLVKLKTKCFSLWIFDVIPCILFILPILPF